MITLPEREEIRRMCSEVKDRLSFRGLLKDFEIDIFVRDYYVVVRLSWAVPDARAQNGELITVHSDMTLDVHAFTHDPKPEDYLIRFVHMVVKEALWHELDEGFWLDGSYYRHPHPHLHPEEHS